MFNLDDVHISVILRSRMKHPHIQEKVVSFIKKYFLEGQKLEEKQKEAIETLPNDAPFWKKILVKHRRIIGQCYYSVES